MCLVQSLGTSTFTVRCSPRQVLVERWVEVSRSDTWQRGMTTLTNELVGVDPVRLPGRSLLDPSTDVWRQQTIWFNTAVSGVLASELFPLLYSFFQITHF